MTEVSECSQQRGNLKDNGYILLTEGKTSEYSHYDWHTRGCG
ncbi:hypothetical protein [Photorhabdus kayaii]|nr:hypothetical protein [Photorhabdus kayaii]